MIIYGEFLWGLRRAIKKEEEPKAIVVLHFVSSRKCHVANNDLFSEEQRCYTILGNGSLRV